MSFRTIFIEPVVTVKNNKEGRQALQKSTRLKKQAGAPEQEHRVANWLSYNTLYIKCS